MVGHVSQSNMFQRFLHSQVIGALILIATTVIALIWANSAWGQFYYDLSHTYLGVRFGDAEFKLTLSHWIKDGLMADQQVVPAGQGDGEVRELLRALQARGYDGFLSLEPHLTHAGPFSGFSGPELFGVAVKALRELLAEMGA